jgi:hypothetical protein|uniref:Uncharacterized protein n=1 Tax=Myoviridae sp. ctPuP5 TaxID=2823543 RepID=A0A8S5L9J6_9CAUD|nr:MAG TPA: hypothetical protein [Myoviridae sp. ctPuP5]
MKKFVEYIKLLIKSNNGDSSKSFFLVSVTLTGILLLLICGLVLIIDVCCTGYIITDLYGIATVIASIASLFGAVGWTKVAGEKRFYDYKKYYPEEKQKLNNKSSDESTSVKPSEDDIENALK